MPETSDAKTLIYSIVRHPVYNRYDLYHICNIYICINDTLYINDIY